MEKKKPGIRERIAHAFSWLRPHRGDRHTSPHNEYNNNSNTSFNSGQECPTPTTSDLKTRGNLINDKKELQVSSFNSNNSFSVTRDQDNNNNNNNREKKRKQQVQERHLDPLASFENNCFATTDCTPPDQSDFFSFLDDVTAGKHKELLQEMIEQVSSENNKTNNNNNSSSSNNVQNKNENDSITPFDNERFSSLLNTNTENKNSKKKLGKNNEENLLKQPSFRSPGSYEASSAARLLKDYELMAYLGRGTFAEVTLARHKTTHELFALKMISKRKVREEHCIQRTFTERQLLASLKHPFLVGLHRAFQSRTHLYLLLDFAQGGDLYFFLERKPWVKGMRRKLRRLRNRFRTNDWSKKQTRDNIGEGTDNLNNIKDNVASIMTTPYSSFVGILPPIALDGTRTPIRLVAFYAVEIALVLLYLHDHGFVYRDLKPENILMARTGHIMLTDFGVAKYSGRGKAKKAGTERTSSFTGTTQYMSPEMLLGKPHDCRIDWWSFGCLLFEMATGRRPFESENQYAVVKAIVESDVCIESDDFKLTQLEIDTRVEQLQKRHQEYKIYLLRHIIYQENIEGKEKKEEEKEISHLGNSTRDKYFDFFTPSGLPQSTRSIDDDFSFPYNNSSIDFKELLNNNNNTNKEIINSSLNITSEDRYLYQKYAIEEMTEACTLLKELILLLLQRSQDNRLMGTAVLEHPFFTCSYVTSQLYYKKLMYTSGGSNKMDGSLFGCSSSKISLGDSFLSDFLKPASYLSSTSTSNYQNNNNNNNIAYTSAADAATYSGSGGNELNVESKNDENHNLKANVIRLKHFLCAKVFLSLPQIQRPENWRDLFLARRVRPPYIPHLLALDDLRYFPSAITATGDSILKQQLALRGQGKRKNINNQIRDIEDINKTSVSNASIVTFLHNSNWSEEEPETEGVLRTETGQISSGNSFTETKNSSFLPKQEFKEEHQEQKQHHEEEEEEEEVDDENIGSEDKYQTSERRRHNSGGSLSPHLSEMSELVSTTSAKLQTSRRYSKELDEDVNIHPITTLVKGNSLQEGISQLAVANTVEHVTENEQVTMTSISSTSSLSETDLGENENFDAKYKPFTYLFFPSERQTTPTPLFTVSLTSLGKNRGSIFSSKDKQKESSSSSFQSHVTTDDDDCLLQTLAETNELLPHTLHGVAYDVDDYVPCTSKQKGMILQSFTGIPARKSSDSLSEEDKLSPQIRSLPQPRQQNITESRAFSTSSEVPPCRPLSPCAVPLSDMPASYFSRAPSVLHNNANTNSNDNTNANNNHFTMSDTRRVSSISLYSFNDAPAHRLSYSPRGVREVAPPPAPPPPAAAVVITTIAAAGEGGLLEEQGNSQVLENSSMTGPGGAQHYLGFTFDAHSSGAFLLSGAGNSNGNDKMNFSEFT